MNTLSPTNRNRPAAAIRCRARSGGSCTADPLPEIRDASATAIPMRLVPAGFTLVELLVVISIIAILVALTIPVVMGARARTKNGAIAFEVGQIDMAIKHYKADFGDYPPDFAGICGAQSTQTDPLTGNPGVQYQVEAQNLVLQHFSKVFPMYTPGLPSGSSKPTQWLKFRDDVLQFWSIDVNNLTPSAAVVFFLGGQPVWFLKPNGNPILPGDPLFNPSKPVQRFLGFSANQNNPFDASTSRIHPYYDFDLASVGWLNGGLVCWPKEQGVDTTNPTGPMVYFRAENSNYTINGYTLNLRKIGNAPPISPIHFISTNVKCDPTTGLYAAVDTRYSNFKDMYNYNSSKAIVYTWVNPQGFQIFTSGLDQRYAPPYIPSPPAPSATLVDCTTFPTGESYYIPQPPDPNANANPFDNITNFSNGTLESAMKANP